MNNQHLGDAKFLETKSRIDLLAEKKKCKTVREMVKSDGHHIFVWVGNADERRQEWAITRRRKPLIVQIDRPAES